MGRTMIAALIATGMLAGCTDWREGEETVEACVKRHALKEGAVDPLADDPGVWVPAYTYDITKLEGSAEFLREMAGRGGNVSVVLTNSGKDNAVATRDAIDQFDDTPATEAGLVVLTDDGSFYKVRGKPSRYSVLLRQGCEGQRTGMRLVRMSFYREDALVDGEIPPPEMTATQRREIIDKLNKPLIKDPLP